jgi:hypothetical protein
MTQQHDSVFQSNILLFWLGHVSPSMLHSYSASTFNDTAEGPRYQSLT